MDDQTVISSRQFRTIGKWRSGKLSTRNLAALWEPDVKIRKYMYAEIFETYKNLHTGRDLHSRVRYLGNLSCFTHFMLTIFGTECVIERRHLVLDALFIAIISRLRRVSYGATLLFAKCLFNKILSDRHGQLFTMEHTPESQELYEHVQTMPVAFVMCELLTLCTKHKFPKMYSILNAAPQKWYMSLSQFIDKEFATMPQLNVSYEGEIPVKCDIKMENVLMNLKCGWSTTDEINTKIHSIASAVLIGGVYKTCVFNMLRGETIEYITPTTTPEHCARLLALMKKD